VKKGGLPGTRKVDPADTIKINQPRLPMPNLNDVGTDLLAQGAFPILVGGQSETDSNVVKLKKYNDALKALAKLDHGQFIMHDSTAKETCFVHLAKLGKPKSGLSPDRINNKMFAEVLALKLNVLASLYGKFPPGFDSLIYDYHKVQPGPFDSLTVANILHIANIYLKTCDSLPPNATPPDLYFVLRLINKSFSGPIDTIRWSCDKLQLTGVRTLKDVPWLRANPGVTIPVFVVPEGARVPVVPQSYALQQNYPNPFNPTTTIEFDLPEPAVVTLVVYNTLGQEVARLFDHESMDEGEQEIEFNASHLPSGVYFYRITAQAVVDNDEGITILGQTFTKVKKMVLIK
jgi:hypothetical protein